MRLGLVVKLRLNGSAILPLDSSVHSVTVAVSAFAGSPRMSASPSIVEADFTAHNLFASRYYSKRNPSK